MKKSNSSPLIQPSIFDGMRNMKAMSEKQRKRKEYLSSTIIEVHSSDSESDSFYEKPKIPIKRKLFSSTDTEDSGNESIGKDQKQNLHTPSPSKKCHTMTINKPKKCSTPIITCKEPSSPLDVSDIKPGDETIKNLDSSSDTIILEDSKENSNPKNPYDETTRLLSLSDCEPLLHADLKCESKADPNNTAPLSNHIEQNGNSTSQSNQQILVENIKKDLDSATAKQNDPDIESTVEKNGLKTSPIKKIGICSPRKPKQENNGSSENLSQTSSGSRPCPRSPSKKTPRNKANKENKTINMSYLTVLKDLLSVFEQNPFIQNLLLDEKHILRIFTSESSECNYQYVCLKLLTWKTKWYNIFKFCEKINLKLENHEIVKIYNHLQEDNVVDTDFTNEDIFSLLNLLDMSDVQSICTHFKLKKANTKEERIKVLLKFCNTQSTLISSKSSRDLLLKEISKKMGNCVKLKKEFIDSFYNVYLLATYTNTAFANITDYFTNVLGLKICFPSYRVEHYKVFYSRQEFLDFAKARKLDDDYENASSNKNHFGALEIAEEIYEELVKLETIKEDENRFKEAPHLKRYTAKSVHTSTLSRAAKNLSTKYPQSAKKWLEYMIAKIKSHRIGEWYYILSWIYMKYTEPPDYERAAILVIEVLTEHDSFLSELQIHNLKKRAEQIDNAKKAKIENLYRDIIAGFLPGPALEFPTTSVDATTLRSNELGKKRSYVKSDDEGNKTFMSVENIALDYYLTVCDFTGGRHCEGALIQALFALSFWDIIYETEPPVPGTFLSKIQQFPLDMKTPNFYLNRKAAIDERIEAIESTWQAIDLLTFLRDNYNLHAHEAGIYKIDSVIGDIEADSFIEILVDCIGRQTLGRIFRRLVKNLGAFRSGMPDLLVWNFEQKTSKFVEVKGEGDRLQPNQELWLSYLQSIGANIEVCHVHSLGSKRKKLRISN